MNQDRPMCHQGPPPMKLDPGIRVPRDVLEGLESYFLHESLDGRQDPEVAAHLAVLAKLLAPPPVFVNTGEEGAGVLGPGVRWSPPEP